MSRAAAAVHLRHAIAELRASKTSISKSRGRLPVGRDESELAAIPPELLRAEQKLIAIARRLEAAEPAQMPLEVSP